MPSEACVEELETLGAIFLDEIEIRDNQPDGATVVSMVLFPATGDDEESRYVTLTIDISLCKSYPKVPPKIVFRNPRGLNDDMLDDLMTKMRERCAERIESQMIYELIDMAKEFLSRNNRPASECPICLLLFTEFDVFFRSKCFHHFHSHCLGTYLQNLVMMSESETSLPNEKRELTCPVCREKLEDDIDVAKLVSAPPPSEEFESNSKDASSVLQEWEGKRQSMKKLYEKQKSQGGIIDLTDKNKKLLVISSPRENVGTNSESQSTRIGNGSAGSFHNSNGLSSTAGESQLSQRQGNGSQTNGPTGQQRSKTRGYTQFHSQSNSSRHRFVHGHGDHSLGAGSASNGSKPNSENCTSSGGADVRDPVNCHEDRIGHENGHSRKVRGNGGYSRRRHK